MGAVTAQRVMLTRTAKAPRHAVTPRRRRDPRQEATVLGKARGYPLFFTTEPEE